MTAQLSGESCVSALCLCGRTERHLPNIDCYVVVFQDEARSTASETGGKVEHDAE